MRSRFRLRRDLAGAVPARGRDTVRQDTIELPVTPGPYPMVGTSASPVDFFIRAELVDASGNPGRVTRHGDGWTRMCEG